MEEFHVFDINVRVCVCAYAREVFILMITQTEETTFSTYYSQWHVLFIPERAQHTFQ